MKTNKENDSHPVHIVLRDWTKSLKEAKIKYSKTERYNPARKGSK